MIYESPEELFKITKELAKKPTKIFKGQLFIAWGGFFCEIDLEEITDKNSIYHFISIIKKVYRHSRKGNDEELIKQSRYFSAHLETLYGKIKNKKPFSTTYRLEVKELGEKLESFGGKRDEIRLVG